MYLGRGYDLGPDGRFRREARLLAALHGLEEFEGRHAFAGGMLSDTSAAVLDGEALPERTPVAVRCT